MSHQTTLPDFGFPVFVFHQRGSVPHTYTQTILDSWLEIRPKPDRKKYYAVLKGRKPAHIFDSWYHCQGAVQKYHGAEYAVFSTLSEACTYLTSHGQSPIITTDE